MLSALLAGHAGGGDARPIRLPTGFAALIFASDLGSPRALAARRRPGARGNAGHRGLGPQLAARDRLAIACPSCGGRMRLIATIHDPAVIRRILEHLRAARRVRAPVTFPEA